MEVDGRPRSPRRCAVLDWTSAGDLFWNVFIGCVWGLGVV